MRIGGRGRGAGFDAREPPEPLLPLPRLLKRWPRPANGEELEFARDLAFEGDADFRLDRELVDLRFEAADLLLDLEDVFLLDLEDLRTAIRLQGKAF